VHGRINLHVVETKLSTDKVDAMCYSYFLTLDMKSCIYPPKNLSELLLENPYLPHIETPFMKGIINRLQNESQKVYSYIWT